MQQQARTCNAPATPRSKGPPRCLHCKSYRLDGRVVVRCAVWESGMGLGGGGGGGGGRGCGSGQKGLGQGRARGVQGRRRREEPDGFIRCAAGDWGGHIALAGKVVMAAAAADTQWGEQECSKRSHARRGA